MEPPLGELKLPGAFLGIRDNGEYRRFFIGGWLNEPIILALPSYFPSLLATRLGLCVMEDAFLHVLNTRAPSYTLT